MKRVFALLCTLVLLTISVSALAASPKTDHPGEIISRQASFKTEPSLGSTTISVLKNGETFYIQGTDGDWYYVAVKQADGTYKYGYVLSFYAVKDPTHLVIRASSGSRGGTYAYAAPTLTNKRVGTVNAYDRFTVIAETSNYYVVSFREAVCYLSKSADYWEEEDEEMQDLLAKKTVAYTVNEDKTPIYGHTDGKHQSVGTLKAGTTIRVLGKENGYFIFKYNTVIAYIKQDAVTKK